MKGEKCNALLPEFSVDLCLGRELTTPPPLPEFSMDLCKGRE